MTRGIETRPAWAYPTRPEIADETERFIREFREEHSYGPSVREIQAGVGLASSNTVWRALWTLRAAGRATWEQGLSRTVRLVAP